MVFSSNDSFSKELLPTVYVPVNLFELRFYGRFEFRKASDFIAVNTSVYRSLPYDTYARNLLARIRDQ